MAPNKPGLHVLRDIDLAILAAYIDWAPASFQTWDLAGSFPKILEDDVVGETARSVLPTARPCSNSLLRRSGFLANAVFGLYPANTVGDDIELYADESRRETRMTWHNLRQQHERPSGKLNYCLSDFIAEKGCADWIGAFAVTAGIGIETKLAEFEAAHDDYRAIMLKALARSTGRSLCRVVARTGAPRLLGLRGG